LHALRTYLVKRVLDDAGPVSEELQRLELAMDECRDYSQQREGQQEGDERSHRSGLPHAQRGFEVGIHSSTRGYRTSSNRSESRNKERNECEKESECGKKKKRV